jgi:tryptophanyl-tRNA synthetase
MPAFATDQRPIRVLSGIQPSGVLHLGNYVGAVRRWAENLRTLNETRFYMIADLHAITLPHDPAELRRNTLATAAALIASGLDPDKATLFLQSQVPEHAQLQWVLSSVAQLGELNRMTQFKEKSDRHRGTSSLALYAYPVLQAADILLYDADEVPVGDDQRQHVELARDLAKRFNARYGDVFIVPRTVTPKAGARLMDLQMPEKKMSKSLNSPRGTIFLDDPDDRIRAKVRRAVTDTKGKVTLSAGQPGVRNLLILYGSVTGLSADEAQAKFADASYGELKNAVAEAVVEAISPVRESFERLMSDPGSLRDVLERGSADARRSASVVLSRAMDAIGLVQPRGQAGLGS